MNSKLTQSTRERRRPDAARREGRSSAVEVFVDVGVLDRSQQLRQQRSDGLVAQSPLGEGRGLDRDVARGAKSSLFEKSWEDGGCRGVIPVVSVQQGVQG
jgi:hypothetical protein